MTSLPYVRICQTLFSQDPRLTSLLSVAKVAGVEKAQFKGQIFHKLDSETLSAKIQDLMALMAT